MKSQSSRPRNASKISPDVAARLLRDGAVFPAPSDELVAAAGYLSELGVLTFQWLEFVRCAHPRDRDFPPRQRHCRGRVFLPDAETVSRADLRCPECDRSVYPDQYRKQRFVEMRTQVDRDPVITYLANLLGHEGVEVESGAFRVTVDSQSVWVCVVDYVAAKYLARDRALQHPTCFIVVDSQESANRFLQEDWVKRTTLADIVCGVADLPELVGQLVALSPPAQVLQASLPIWEDGPSSLVVPPQRLPKRKFLVEVGANVVRVEGLQVVAKQAGTRFLLFRALWQAFLADLQAQLAPDQFQAQPVHQLIQVLPTAADAVDVDEMSVRRAINRLQSDIEHAVKKNLGLPIGREDVVQTCAWSGQNSQNHGYRLNPHTVTVRPFLSDLS